MEKFSIILKITDDSCFERKEVKRIINKLSSKYGFTLIKLRNNYIMTPNLIPVLYMNNINIQYSALIKYVSLLRFLIKNNCLKIVKVMGDFNFKSIINSFIHFLNNGPTSDGFLWYTVSHSIFDGMNVHKLMVNNNLVSPASFDLKWFSSNLRDTVRLIKVENNDCCLVVNPVEGVDFFVGKYFINDDLHVMALIKLAGLNIKKNGIKKVNYLNNYSPLHPLNVLINNVNRNILGVEGEVKNTITKSQKEYQWLDSNDGMNKITLADNIKYSELCSCQNEKHCDTIKWGEVKKLGKLLTPLILISDVKNTITGFTNKYIHYYDITPEVMKKLFYPDNMTLFQTVMKIVCNDFLPSWGQDIKVKVVFYSKFFRSTNEPYFTGLNIKSPDRLINYWFEVFNYTPITVLRKNGVYYDNGKFIKNEQYQHNSYSVIGNVEIKQPKRVIKVAYV